MVSSDLKNEWRLLKYMIRKNYSNLNESEFWSIMFKEHKAMFPNILKLRLISLVLPTTSVEAERGFSTLNYIKNDFRNSIGKFIFSPK